MSLTILDNKPIKQRIRRSCSICNTDNRITIVNKDGIHKCVHCWKKTNKYEELAVYCNNCSNLSPQNLTKYCKKCNLSVGYCCMAVCIETNDQYICRHCFKYKCIKCNYETKNNIMFKQHNLNYHSNKDERENNFKFYCKLCDYGSFSKDLLEKHNLTEKHKKHECNMK